MTQLLKCTYYSDKKSTLRKEEHELSTIVYNFLTRQNFVYYFPYSYLNNSLLQTIEELVGTRGTTASRLEIEFKAEHSSEIAKHLNTEIEKYNCGQKSAYRIICIDVAKFCMHNNSFSDIDDLLKYIKQKNKPQATEAFLLTGRNKSFWERFDAFLGKTDVEVCVSTHSNGKKLYEIISSSLPNNVSTERKSLVHDEVSFKNESHLEEIRKIASECFYSKVRFSQILRRSGQDINLSNDFWYRYVAHLIKDDYSINNYVKDYKRVLGKEHRYQYSFLPQIYFWFKKGGSEEVQLKAKIKNAVDELYDFERKHPYRSFKALQKLAIQSLDLGGNKYLEFLGDILSDQLKYEYDEEGEKGSEYSHQTRYYSMAVRREMEYYTDIFDKVLECLNKPESGVIKFLFSHLSHSSYSNLQRERLKRKLDSIEKDVNSNRLKFKGKEELYFSKLQERMERTF